jgi:tripartite-type tricarboxylate transporter receptor subunit TctC
MLIKKFIALVLISLSASAFAKTETIKIYSPYSPGHSGTPALLRIVDQANADQNIYKFLVEFKPGGNQMIAVRSIDENSLAIIAPAFVENVESGKLNEKDYVPVYAFGDACWAVVTNKPLTGQKEFVVGGVGFGNAAHLTALALGEKFNFGVRYIVFRSNNDALVNMAGDNGVEFVIDKYEGYEGLRTKNPKMRMVAASCPARLPQEPKIKTLKEQGIDAPYIFNIVVAGKEMSEGRRKAIGMILDRATITVGKEEIFKLSAQRPPIFDGVTAEQFYEKSISLVRNLQSKYRKQIEESKTSK